MSKLFTDTMNAGITSKLFELDDKLQENQDKYNYLLRERKTLKEQQKKLLEFQNDINNEHSIN